MDDLDIVGLGKLDRTNAAFGFSFNWLKVYRFICAMNTAFLTGRCVLQSIERTVSVQREDFVITRVTFEYAERRNGTV